MTTRFAAQASFITLDAAAYAHNAQVFRIGFHGVTQRGTRDTTPAALRAAPPGEPALTSCEDGDRIGHCLVFDQLEIRRQKCVEFTTLDSERRPLRRRAEKKEARE